MSCKAIIRGKYTKKKIRRRRKLIIIIFCLFRMKGKRKTKMLTHCDIFHASLSSKRCSYSLSFQLLAPVVRKIIFLIATIRKKISPPLNFSTFHSLFKFYVSNFCREKNRSSFLIDHNINE